MNHSEFRRILELEFGSAYGQALARSLALPTMGHRTPADLLDDGYAPQHVWSALCAEMNIDDKAFLHRKKQDEN